MLVQNKIIDAAKKVILSSLASNWTGSTWHIYGQFDQADTQGVKYPNIVIRCFDETPMYPYNKLGICKAQLELTTRAIRVTDLYGEGTTATDFETVSDLVFNPFLTVDDIETTMSFNSVDIKYHSMVEDGLEVTPIADGWMASQKFEVICSRTSF